MKAIWCFKVIFGILLIVGIVLLSVSFSIVPQNNVAILQQVYSKTVDPAKLYNSGIHVVGIQNRLISFPQDFQALVFTNNPKANVTNQQSNVVSSSLDGTQIAFSAVIYYTYIPERLPALFALYPTTGLHAQVLGKSAKTIMASVVNRYSYNDFLNNRVSINKEMSYLISKDFVLNLFVKFKLLLITNIILETAHENSLVSTFLLKQGEISSQANNTINQIQAQIDLLTAQTNNIIATSIQKANILSASQKGVYLLQSENIKMNKTQVSINAIKAKYANEADYSRCLQMFNLFLQDTDKSIVWNSNLVA